MNRNPITTFRNLETYRIRIGSAPARPEPLRDGGDVTGIENENEMFVVISIEP